MTYLARHHVDGTIHVLNVVIQHTIAVFRWCFVRFRTLIRIEHLGAAVRLVLLGRRLFGRSLQSDKIKNDN